MPILEDRYQTSLGTERERISHRLPGKRDRLNERKDGLDQRGHQNPLGPASDVERTQERFAFLLS